MTLSQIHTCRRKESVSSMLTGQEGALEELGESSYLHPFGKARGH